MTGPISPTDASPDDSFAPEVRRVLPWLILIRLTVNTALRMAYSFLPAFARGAQISNTSMGAVLAVRDLSGLIAPMVGRAADRKGTGRVLAAAGVGGALGMAISATAPAGLIIGFVIVGLSAVALNVTSGAWIGHAVAYERRAKATGFVELSWGGAALLGIPLMGVLIDQAGWRAAPAVLTLIALPASLVMIQHSASMSAADPTESPKPVMTRTATASLASFTLLVASAQFLFLGHGLWLEDTYDLSATGIGLVVFGAAVMEVVATLATTRLTDGLGKQRSIILGTGLMVAAMVVLAIIPAAPLLFAAVLLAATFLGFEFAIVSAIPLMSELDPHARAAMVARATALSTVGRAVVSLIAVGIYERFGFGTLMFIAAVVGATTLGLTLFVADEPPGSTGPAS